MRDGDYGFVLAGALRLCGAIAQNCRDCGAAFEPPIAAWRLNLMLLPPPTLHELWEVTLLTSMELVAAQAEPESASGAVPRAIP